MTMSQLSSTEDDLASGVVESRQRDMVPSPPPYSIYNGREKWILVFMAGVAGLFSPLPANIYFPAIPTLTAVFHKSVEELNLTVTIYLAMQGASPMLWGPLSDRYGRRPLFLVCFLILILSCLGLALCPPSAFWLLLLLRAVQAGGCASTIALGSGVIGDIATPEERGGFFGMFNLGPMLAPCIGPAVGGALSEHLGWRSIFWFLVIFASACFVMLLLFLPETTRCLAGDGSRRPKGVIYRTLVPIASSGQAAISVIHSTEKLDHTTAASPGPDKKKLSINPFPLLIQPDIALTLLYTGILYAVNYTVTTTISSSYADAYPSLSQTILGICYLPTGLGMILGSTINGHLLDRDFARIKRKQNHTDGTAQDFPLEYARLRMMKWLLLVFVTSVVGWGWCVESRSHIAGPLVLQVTLGYTSIAVLNSTMTLMIDIIKEQSSGVIACTNLVRCSLAAMLVAVIDRSTANLGHGWTYTLLGGICALLVFAVQAEIRWGPKWRQRRSTAGGKSTLVADNDMVS